MKSAVEEFIEKRGNKYYISRVNLTYANDKLTWGEITKKGSKIILFGEEFIVRRFDILRDWLEMEKEENYILVELKCEI